MVQLKFVINFKLNIIKILLLYHKKRKYNDYEVCSSLKTIAPSLSIEHSSINHFSLLVCGIPFLTLFMMSVSVVGSIGLSVVLSLFLFIISLIMSSVLALYVFLVLYLFLDRRVVDILLVALDLLDLACLFLLYFLI